MCVAKQWTVCEDVPKAIPPFPESTDPHLTFPDPLKWNVHFSMAIISGKALQGNWICLSTAPFHSDLIKGGLESPLSHGNCSERQENVHHWGADQKRHWPPSRRDTTPHQRSCYKSLKRAPDSNVWQHHQYWCGRKFFQSRLCHRTLILIVLCTSLGAGCDSKMVMASGLGVRGQYHCWIWTWSFSCKQYRGPRQSSCPRRHSDQPKKVMSGVTEQLWLFHFVSFDFIPLINFFSYPKAVPLRLKICFSRET